MNNIGEQNETRGFMKSTYEDTKADKSKELNANMTIKEQPQDEYANKIKNLGGNN